MIGSINHIAIAVPDIRAAMAQWQARTGAEISDIQTLPEHGVHVAFIRAENGKVELLEPIDDSSPIAKFLEKNPDGGMHHICFDVADLTASRDRLIARGRTGSGRGRAAYRCPWKAGNFCTSQRLDRHSYRIAAGLIWILFLQLLSIFCYGGGFFSWCCPLGQSRPRSKFWVRPPLPLKSRAS